METAAAHLARHGPRVLLAAVKERHIGSGREFPTLSPSCPPRPGAESAFPTMWSRLCLCVCETESNTVRGVCFRNSREMFPIYKVSLGFACTSLRTLRAFEPQPTQIVKSQSSRNKAKDVSLCFRVLHELLPGLAHLFSYRYSEAGGPIMARFMQRCDPLCFPSPLLSYISVRCPYRHTPSHA